MSKNRLEYDRELKAKMRAIRKAQGLCTRCGKELDDPNKTTCFDCREYQRDRRLKMLMLGICPMCGKQHIMGDEKMCFDCAEKTRAKDKAKREKYRDSLNQAQRIYHRELTESRKASGLCYRCGKRKPTGGFKSCTLCRYRMAENLRKRRLRNERG